MKYRVLSIVIGSALVVILSSISRDIFGESVWPARIFLAATTGFVIFSVLLALGLMMGQDEQDSK